MRVFSVPAKLDDMLASRASAELLPKFQLVERFVEEFAKTPPHYLPPESIRKHVRRRYDIAEPIDKALSNLAKQLNFSKGAVFRAAMRRGLGIE